MYSISGPVFGSTVSTLALKGSSHLLNKALKLCLQAGGVALVLLLATSAFLAFSREVPLDRRSAPAPGEWVGVSHVHTALSDGGGTVDDVVEAAAGLGLDFVLLTDHNLRAVPAHRYRDGVLLVVGEEVNTDHGHLLVLGDQPIGNRKGVDPGPAVRPEEGLRIVAHPGGRPSWKEWDTASFDGIEIWNADTERRRGDPLGEWIRAVAILPWRPVTAFYQLLDSPDGLERWDALPARARVFGICSVDAHHRMPLGPERYIPLPSYRQSFMLARQHVLLPEAPSGEGPRDGRAVLDAIRQGRSYCAFDGLADARGLRVRARGGEGEVSAELGGEIPWTDGIELKVELPAAGDRARIRVLGDGVEVARSPGPRWRGRLPGPGSYRVEAWLELDGRRLPWIFTNPIRVVAEADEP